MIDLCLLGTGGAIPLPERGLASLYVRVNGRILLIDCGEGTQNAIRRLGWGFAHIDGIFLTHYHADHCGGLPGLMLSLAKCGRTAPLPIWGGPGLTRIVNGLRVIAPTLPYPVELHEFTEESSCFTAAGLSLQAFPLHHSVPCWGLRAELNRAPAFLPEKAKALGIPVHFWKQLQRGESVSWEGRTFEPAQVTMPQKKNLSFLYATDTRPVERIVQMGRNTDLMILEGMYGSDEKLPQALANRHMLFREAADLACRAGTKQLVLTHFSNCIEEPEEYLMEAAKIFPNTRCGQDLMTLSLDYEARTHLLEEIE